MIFLTSAWTTSNRMSGSGRRLSHGRGFILRRVAGSAMRPRSAGCDTHDWPRQSCWSAVSAGQRQSVAGARKVCPAGTKPSRVAPQSRTASQLHLLRESMNRNGCGSSRWFWTRRKVHSRWFPFLRASSVPRPSQAACRSESHRPLCLTYRGAG